jgi:hypothetical protein
MHLTDGKNADAGLTFSPAFRHPASRHLLMLFQHQIPNITTAAAMHGHAVLIPFRHLQVWTYRVYCIAFHLF